ncbi:MAG TPA: pyruvate ferredoxin oxidoreductase [Sutterellaceae bacterium]|nr:pyruvate ferredoxin oxidoreductase [Sutterellaceae bacterium]
MLKQIEGSQAVALGVALCRPEVICAYPISPQTHIVESLGNLVRQGKINPCEFINVESEFAAMSTSIGASVAGARAYTATASQGLLFMVEAIYNAAGLGLPIVMTVANRAIGAPINIWNDHSDSLSQRDSGWIQLFVEDNQQAVDVHIQAFKIAEIMSLPVMVCMDGFVLTHAVDRVDIPEQQAVDAYLPPYTPRQVLDPSDPVTIGAMVGPEAFTEVRYLAHAKHISALSCIEKSAQLFKERFGRDSGGLLKTYRCEDAAVRILAMGSSVGTIEDAVDELRAEGLKVGVVSLRCFRPFPMQAVREALQGARVAIVLDRAIGAGSGGVVLLDVVNAMRCSEVAIKSVIGGLGGRAITKKSIKDILRAANEGTLSDTTFMDLDEDLVRRQLEREQASRRCGPLPESVMHDVATRETIQE